MAGNSRHHAWFRALDHARMLGIKPWWRVGDYYTVDSPSGQRYIVRRQGATYTCTCTAAAAGHVCWHRALVAALPHEITKRREQVAAHE